MFKVYNNIKQSNVEQKFLTDLTQVIAGVNKYYDVSEKYPTAGDLDSTTSGWNKTETYVPFNVGNKWTIGTDRTNKITVTPKSGKYNNIKADYKLETFNKKCEMGSQAAQGCVLLVDKYNSGN
jgi:hypothetical protein